MIISELTALMIFNIVAGDSSDNVGYQRSHFKCLILYFIASRFETLGGVGTARSKPQERIGDRRC